MQQPTLPPGQPGGPGSVRRAPTVAPPVIRTRQQELPTTRIRPPNPLLRLLEDAQTYILSEETLILVEFLVVLAIGVFVFVTALHPMENLMQTIGSSLSGLKLFGSSSS